MKIAFVAQPFDVLPPVRGGSIAIYIDEVARRLAPFHEITVYSARAADQAAQEECQGIRHVRLDVERDRRRVATVERIERAVGRITGTRPDLFYPHYYFSSRYFAGYAAAVAEALAESDAELVAVPNFAQFLPTLKRRNPRKRFVLIMQCDWLIELPERQVRAWTAPADGISGCSDYIIDGVAARFPELADRCRTVYNASDPEAFGVVPVDDPRVDALRAKLGIGDDRVVLFTGRVCPEKGVDVLLEAFRRVADAAPDAVLLVVGGLSRQPPSPRWVFGRDPAFARFEEHRGDYGEYLESLRRGCEDRIRLLGSVPHTELPPYYAMSQVFVHPAVWNEPFGMILTEAMLAECAVVSSRGGGIPEIVEEGKTGLLAEPGDAASLADCILRLLDAPERCRAMGERGRQRVRETFTWEHTTDQLEELFALAARR